MKKLLILLMTSALLLSGCVKEKNESESNSPSPTGTFEEFENVEVEVKDYVDESPSPSPTLSPTAAPSASPSAAVAPSGNNTSAGAQTASKNTGTADAAATEQTTTEQNVSAVSNSSSPESSDTTTVDLSGKIICIDPGHGLFTGSKTENIAPNSSVKKAAYKEGTKGKNSIEDTVTLAVADKLKKKLEDLGATVIMTRTDEYSTMSNIERAQFANTNKANISIKLHADGTQEGGSGMTMLIPGSKYISDSQMLADSKRLGKAVLKNAVAQTGARNRGTYTNSQMTGFNWSEVPVILFEMGFMTNPKDELKLNSSEYQDKIAEGIKLGVIEYFK